MGHWMFGMNALLGACVGDAAGAVLEFCGGPITDEMARHAMTMPGGGKLRVGRGQITDDGELALTLWRSLEGRGERAGEEKAEAEDMETLLDRVRMGYANWYESIPFDMGRTCSLAFEAYYDWKNGDLSKEECHPLVMEWNSLSEANGALMRATGIAAFVASHPEYDVAFGVRLAKEDALLSHPSVVCQEANQVYVFALLLLLQGVVPQEVLRRVDTFVAESVTSEKVRQWYQESVEIAEMDCTRNIGHLRWGFTLAFYFLRHPAIPYEEAIRMTLRKGGDTDTNAAIVGGMVACWQPIPREMVEPVRTFDGTKESRASRIRPKEYHVKDVFCKGGS